MSVLQKVILERTSLYHRCKMTTMIPKPTKHFPKYTIIEATSLFQDLKTQKVFSFQIVIAPKSHLGTHVFITTKNECQQ